MSDWANDGVTEKYLPPEHFFVKDYNKFLADSWAMGIVIFRVFNNGQFPFNGEWQTKLKAQLQRGTKPQLDELLSLTFSA